LEKNKIFFETIGVISLSIIAITVSIGAVLISAYQTSQIELENQPNFLFTMEDSTYNLPPLLHDDSMNISRYNLVIKNVGKPYKKLDLEYLVIAYVQYYSFDKTQNKKIVKRFYIPLQYERNTPRIDPDGNMRKTQVNSLDYLSFYPFRNYINSKGDDLSMITLSRYVKIQYTDIYDKTHTKYFYIYNEGGASELSKEYYENDASRVSFYDDVLLGDVSYIFNQPEGIQEENINETFFEPWYKTLKTKFDEA
jgi:hypothetical protein